MTTTTCGIVLAIILVAWLPLSLWAACALAGQRDDEQGAHAENQPPANERT